MDWKHLLPYLAPVLVVGLMARRLIRNTPRKVNLWRMFIPPVIILLAVIGVLYTSPMPAPLPLWAAGFSVAIILGAAAGFFTTHHQEFSIDQDGEVTARATPVGTAIILALFALRFGLKYVTTGGDPYAAPNVHPSGNVIGWTDAGLMFATGLVFARVITTWFHARPLIAAHKAQKLAAPVSGDAPPGNQ
jgi:hypothetical protein